jgi:hypothetical protein
MDAHSSQNTSFEMTGAPTVLRTDTSHSFFVYYINKPLHALFEYFYCKMKEDTKNNIERLLRLLVRLGNGFVEDLALDLSDLELERSGLA